MPTDKTNTCSACGRTYYPNQMTFETIETSTRTYHLCACCYALLDARLSDKAFVGMIYKSSVPNAEYNAREEHYKHRIMHAMAGYPKRLELAA